MKKKAIIIIACIAAALFLVLIFPFQYTKHDDGTQDWLSLSYRFVKWNKQNGNVGENGLQNYTKNRIYFIPNNFKSINELWELKGTEVNPLAPNLIDMRKWLDENGYVAGMSQSDLFDKLEKYKYKGKSVLEQTKAPQYDTEYGGGVLGDNENFSFGDWYHNEDGKVSNNTYFKTSVNISGLQLPKNVKIGSRLDYVTAAYGVGLNLIDNFKADNESETDMTIFSSDGYTIVLKRESSASYELIFSEKSTISRQDGTQSEVTRSVTLRFAYCNYHTDIILARFDVKIIRNWIDNPLAPNIIDMRKWLDENGYVAGMSQSDLFDKMERYKYNGKSVSKLSDAAQYDTEYGGGVLGDNENFSFGDWYHNEDGKVSNNTYFKTSVNISGLQLPKNVKIGSRLDYVTAAYGVGLELIENFKADNVSESEMTISSSDSYTVVFRKSDNSGDIAPYILILTEKSNFTRKTGTQSEVTRKVTLYFDNNKVNADVVLAKFDVSVVENWAE